jgi:hypothetical protein
MSSSTNNIYLYTHTTYPQSTRTGQPKNTNKAPKTPKSAGPALDKINRNATKIQKTVPGTSRQDAIKAASGAYNKNKGKK